MKQRHFIPVLSILLFLAAGCQQPELTQPVRGTNILKAAIEGAQTKTQLGRVAEGSYYAFWTENESLAVYVDGAGSANAYVLSAGAGSRYGTFAGTVAGTRYVALYPYRDKSAAGVSSDGYLNLEIPAVQDYAPNSFGAGSFPMVAVGEGPELKFWNLFAVLKFSMTGSASVKAVRFVTRPDVQIMAVSGKAKVGLNFQPQNGPEIIMTGENATTELTLRCDGFQLSEDVATDFFLAVPPGLYKGGFSLKVETDAGVYTHVVESDVTFVRSQYRHIAPFRVEPVNTEPTPDNEIWYKNEDNQLLPLAPAWFDRVIQSHSYSDGYCKIVFDGPVTRVGNESGDVVFGRSTSEIRLPDCVERIEPNAFEWSRIVSFRVPESLKSMGDGALSWTTELKQLFGKGVTDDGLFLILDGKMVAYAAAALPEGTLVVPAGVTSLPPRLFFAQNKIHDIILSEEMRSIGDGCFGYNDKLETVTFPSNFTDLGMYVFERCFALREFKGDNPCVKDGRLFVTPDQKVVAFAGNGATECVIPDGAAMIAADVFRENKTLRSLTLPESVTDYYTDWVYGCDALEAFYGPLATEDHRCVVSEEFLVAVVPHLPVDYRIPDGIHGITFRVFADNRATERLTLTDDITYLFDGAFSDMPELRTIQLSSRLTNMSRNAFVRCPKLDSILFRSYAPPAYEEDESIAHAGLTILVPEGAESMYKRNSMWSQYASYIKGVRYTDLAEPDYYLSKDYSQDGLVHTLQTAAKGQGIDIVLMGDGFSDRQIADGTYAGVMELMADAFFTDEPYKSYRDLFNVYAVNVVSATEGYEQAGQALGTYIGTGSIVGGSDTQCMAYARNAVSDDRMENTLIIVAMNSKNGGGTCYMYSPQEWKDVDFGCGMAVSYFATGSDDFYLARVLIHEAGGHGFAKLADEYANEEKGMITASEKERTMVNVPSGWWKNVDFTDDPNCIKWARFLADDRYKNEDLGIIEGGLTYWKGVWSPSEASNMRYNVGGFNAPSREAIWYRMHKLAYGTDWTYNYEDFVAYDAINRQKTTVTAPGPWRSAYTTVKRPSAPPVVVGKTWKQAMKESAGVMPDRR